MNCSVIGQSTFIFSFLYIKLVFVSVESVHNTGIRDLMDSRGEKFQTKQVEVMFLINCTLFSSYVYDL